MWDAGGVCPVVVSQRFAREFLDGVGVIGKTLHTADGGTLEIIGIFRKRFDLLTVSLQPAIYAHGRRPNFAAICAFSSRGRQRGDEAGDLTDILSKTFTGPESRRARCIQ